jgi:hypothetical protein
MDILDRTVVDSLQRVDQRDRIPDARDALAAELEALVGAVQQHLDPR